MKITAKKMSIMGVVIALLLGFQLGFAASMMEQEMTKQPAKNSMSEDMKDSMGGKHMEENMKDTMDGKKPAMHMEEMKKDKPMSMERTYTVPSDEELRQRLTPLQYRVTRKDATEPAFNNTYWNNHDAGLYVDVISGVPLFSSADKYDSGTGWPSFTRPINPDAVFIKEDRTLFMVRNEVRSKLSDAHLGHVFEDGPKPTGLRYCMNSAALRFIPAADLEKEGYGDYVSLFK